MNTVECYMIDPEGRRPERVATRPRLPQAAIHCPPLEEGNLLGWLVYPNARSSWEVERRPDLIQVTHHAGKDADFGYPFVLKAFEDGSRVAELMPPSGVALGPEQYHQAADAADKAFHDIHNPAGAITVLGNCWFKTPQGWDSVWMGVTNQFDPPTPHAYTVRVQTDWYAGSPAVEVRYQLRIGERMRVDSQTPVGMVVFLPREAPSVEFLPYPQDLRTERGLQIAEKYQAENMRSRSQMSPYSVWYLRKKRP